MIFKPRIEPKNKYKVNYKIVVPFVLLLILLIFAIYQIKSKNDFSQKTKKEYTICKSSVSETRSILSNIKHLEPLEINDFGQYGQTLGLYNSRYNINEEDNFNGKTLFLNNLCNGSESIYMLNVELDNKIPLEILEPGFYQVRILDGLTQKSLISQTDLFESFNTISRDGFVKAAKLIANKKMFVYDDEPVMDENYVFIEVTSQEVNRETYDIVLDPAGLTQDDLGNIDKGGSYKNLNESNEMFDVALGVKKILEEKGLRVLIARDRDYPKNFNGNDGRLHDAYKVSAKYYIQMRLPYSPYDGDKGTTVMYSGHSSSKLASNIMKQLMTNTSLEASIWRSGRNAQGVYRPEQESGYDLNDVIRETGGKFTGASEIGLPFSELNAFANNSRVGMQGIIIEYGYISDETLYSLWSDEKDKIIEATANGILAELGI